MKTVPQAKPGNFLKAFLRRKLPPEATFLYQSACQATRDFKIRCRAPKLFSRRLLQGRPIWLEIGSGSVKGQNGWTTVDVVPGADIQFNVCCPFPLPDACVDKFYSSHCLEHFHYPDIMRLLRECHRVLTPGGTFSICVPDATIFIIGSSDTERMRKLLGGEDPPLMHSDYLSKYFAYHTPIDYLNYIAYMDTTHRHLFDEANLHAIFRAAGFAEVRRRDFDPALDKEVLRYESLYAIATK